MLLILVIYDFVRFSSWTHDVRFCMVILVIYVCVCVCPACIVQSCKYNERQTGKERE